MKSFVSLLSFIKFNPLATSKAPGSHFFKLLCGTIFTCAATLLVLWSPLNVRVHGLLDPFSFNGDALQHIAPLWYVTSSPDAVQDYTLRYYLQAILPPVFKQVYALLTVWITPAAASKLVTVVLSIAFILISTATARRLAGGTAAALAFFLAGGGVVKNLYFMGGIQRGFGFCIASLALYLICCGRTLSLAFLAIVAAMLYPAAAVFIYTGLSFLCILPARHRGILRTWSLPARLGLLAVTAVAIGVAVLPQLQGGKIYGERLSISAESEFEEWGPNGRYTQGDRGVPISFFKKSLSSVVAALSAERESKPTLSNTQEPTDRKTLKHSITVETLPIVVLTLLAGIATLWKNRSTVPSEMVRAEAVRCGVFFFATVMTFLAAQALFPLLYIPSRYVALGLTPLIPVIFPSLWVAAVRSFTPRHLSRFTSLISIVVGVGIFISLGWHELSVKRLPTSSGNRALFAHIKHLPEGSVVATWPRGVASMIPLFTSRPVLVFEEGHQIFHRDFLEEMRRRTRAIIAVYSATDSGPIEALRSTYNVSHILVSKKHLTKTPTYFAPFGREIREAREAVGSTPLFLAELAKTKTVFSDHDYVLVDIRGDL